MDRRGARSLAGLLLVILLVGGGAFALTRGDSDETDSTPDRQPSGDPLARACSLDPAWLHRIERGYDPDHSEDITMVATPPHYPGNFAGPSHSGPWQYLQEVPFVLHGPGFINARQEPLEDRVTIADFFPTVGELLDIDLPEREGEALTGGLADTTETPKLVVVVVWDGVGRNVLERWPDRWPYLEQLETEGTSYAKAIVGSSPSITPATHSTLGTGTFPYTHGVTGIEYRKSNGEMSTAFTGSDPTLLRETTYADIVDAQLNNEPKVGLVGSVPWHLGMLGHGSNIPGGDDDQVVYVGRETLKTTDLEYYGTLSTPLELPSMDTLVEELDLEDGRLDGKWLGRDIDDPRKTPALVRFQTDVVLEMLEQEGYGADDIPDLFFVNFKTGDTIGHQYSMDSPEMGEVISAEDEGLRQIVEYLDAEVGEYTLLLTADHGHTPSWETSGGWPIDNTELILDIDAEFEVPEGESLIEDRVAVGFFMNLDVMEELGVSLEEVSSWMDDYTLRENWPEAELPKAFEGRGEEQLFSAVFPTDDLPEIVACSEQAKPSAAPGD